MKHEARITNQGRLKRIAFYAVPVVCVAILAVIYGSYRLNLQPVDPNSGTTVSFEIPSGQRTPDIARRLQQAGLIRDANTFITYLNIHGLRTTLQAGTYTLSSARSASDIAAILSKGKISSNLLVIPEGSTLIKIEQLANAQGIKTADFKAALRDQYDSQYANQRPSALDLEGYLFPDGYQLTKTTPAHTLIQKMLADFDARMTPDLVNAFAAQGLSVHQGLTLASMIEKEVGNSTDRPIVAQVFLKRLHDGMPMESDVTVHYAADQAGVPFNLSLDSPYNTYRAKGLPIGPICSPGLDSLHAAAHPAGTDYSYFLAGKDGKTHFAKTFAEHQANIQKYLQ